VGKLNRFSIFSLRKAPQKVVVSLPRYEREEKLSVFVWEENYHFHFQGKLDLMYTCHCASFELISIRLKLSFCVRYLKSSRYLVIDHMRKNADVSMTLTVSCERSMQFQTELAFDPIVLWMNTDTNSLTTNVKISCITLGEESDLKMLVRNPHTNTIACWEKKSSELCQHVVETSRRVSSSLVLSE
jgi:hypothetical protein